jgi:hypothetical protein
MMAMIGEDAEERADCPVERGAENIPRDVKGKLFIQVVCLEIPVFVFATTKQQ